MSKHEKYDEHFTAATAVLAEGARVGIATCRECGAAVLIDPRDEINYARLHSEWHASRPIAPNTPSER